MTATAEPRRCSPYPIIKSTANFILLEIFYIFMSAVTTFPQIFSLPGLAGTLNVNRLFCGMKNISHLRMNQLLVTKEIFPVNHSSCKTELF